MIFCLGFLFQFLVAGLTGIMLALAPFDWQLTDSYFVRRALHYTWWRTSLRHLRCFYYCIRKPWASPQPQAGTAAFLAFHYWLSFDVRHDALLGLLGMPRAHLHLRTRARLGAA